MNKKEKNEDGDEVLKGLLRTEELKRFEIWWSWWHWALPILIGYIPEIKRFYIQILSFNIAITITQAK